MRARTFLLCVLSTVLMAVVGAAADWPAVSQAEWSLTAAPGHPNAAAVILRDQGRMVLSRERPSSYLEVYRRVKILNQEGTEYGSVSLASSRYFRMKELEARTLLPDGSVLELPGDAVFEKKYSSYYRQSVTSFAMPGVVPGAIVEYRYKVYFDSVIYPEPWYFQNELPTLHSEITYVIPKGYRFGWSSGSTLPNKKIEQDTTQTSWGLECRFWMDDMPAVPDEPFRPPFEDLSSRVLLLPTAAMLFGRRPLLESWESAIDLLQGEREWGYTKFRTRGKDAKKIARRVAAGATSPRAKAEAAYRWVRDELVSTGYLGVGTADRYGNEVLKEGRADSIEKALILQLMLKYLDIESSIGWVSTHDNGRVIPNVPNPAQFDHAVVVATLDGSRVFLYPFDRSLAFGALPPSLDGVDCLLVDGKKPEWVQTPVLGAEDSVQKAKVQLKLDEEGRLSGTVKLELTGHEAWWKLAWKDTEEETVDGWTKWAEKRYPGFDISDVKVDERIEERLVSVTFALSQREDEVLGDESTVNLAAPLQVFSNPFSLPTQRRLTPVALDSTSTDEVEVEVTWPEGWTVDSRPRLSSLTTDAGALATSLEVNEAARRLTARRTLELRRTSFNSAALYSALRALYERTAANDQETLLLVAGETAS